MSTIIIIFVFILCVTLLLRILLFNLFAQRLQYKDSSIIYLRGIIPFITGVRNNRKNENTNIDIPVSSTYKERQLQVVGGKTKKETASKNLTQTNKAKTKSNKNNIIRLTDKNIREKK